MELDDIVLPVPVEKFNILYWWVECEECDPHSAYATYLYFAHVDLMREVAEWCDENLTGFPTFDQNCFPLPDYENYCRPTVKATHVHLHFLSEAEALLFKLRWF